MSDGMCCKMGYSKICLWLHPSIKRAFSNLTLYRIVHPNPNPQPKQNAFTDFMKKEEASLAIFDSCSRCRFQSKMKRWPTVDILKPLQQIGDLSPTGLGVVKSWYVSLHTVSQKSRNISLPGHRCCQWSDWSPRTATQKRSPRDWPGKGCLEDYFLRWHLLKNILAFFECNFLSVWYGSKYCQQPETLVIIFCTSPNKTGQRGKNICFAEMICLEGRCDGKVDSTKFKGPKLNNICPNMLQVTFFGPLQVDEKFKTTQGNPECSSASLTWVYVPSGPWL